MSNPFDNGYFTEIELRTFGFKAVGENVRIAKSCTIIGLENIEIGDNTRIDGYTSIIAAGNGFAKIGSHVHIAGYCGVYAGSGFTMGDFSGISAGVRIYTGTDDYSGQAMTNPTVPAKFTNVKKGEVILQRHVIIGTGSVVLPLVLASEGAAVGALSVVKGDLDAWSMYAGVPARKFKDRSKALLELENALHRERLSQPS